MALAVLDLDKAIEFNQVDFANGQPSEDQIDLLQDLRARRTSLWSEQQQFAAACDRWDSLYYPPPEAMTAGGVSHWWYNQSAVTPGRAHVSLNTPPTYVDIPASLQAQPPVENLVPLIDSEPARQLAAMTERLYSAWKAEVDLELHGHRACVVKGLYGRTAGKVWWSPDDNFPRIDVIDQPRNLWLGWGQSDYRTLDWACYSYLMTAEAIYADYGLVAIERKDKDGQSFPYLMDATAFTSWTSARSQLWMGGQIEVTDYWYRQPTRDTPPERTRLGRIKHETWNAIIVGNRVAQNQKFSEYDGLIPYVPLFNTYIPGVPTGRPELMDIEQLIREKDERITSGAQLMHNIVNAQYWQLTGPEAPDDVPIGLRPKANQVIAPGAGNRIEGIMPWFPEFQLEQYLTRIDREMIDVSGLNDLLRGLAPASVMSSSKAINALVANYETRISMKRDLYYKWRRDIWEMVRRVWAAKNSDLAGILLGTGRLDIVSPSLTPRDDMETAQIARTLVDGKLWSAIRGMDRVGVDDPEAEQNIIRSEQTDASLNPAAVQVMAQLAQVLQSMGYANAQQATQAIGGGGEQGGPPPGPGAGMEDLRSQVGAAGGVPGSGEQPIPGQEAMPGNTPEGQAVGAGPPPPPRAPGGAIPPRRPLLAQTMVKGGAASNRLLFQQKVGGQGTQPPGGG